MSVEENKVVVRRWIEGWNTRGTDAVDELFSADFTDAQLQEHLGEPVTLDNFKESLRALERSLGRAQFEEKEMLAEGDRVVVLWTMRGTLQGPFLGLPATGRPYAVDGLNIFRVTEGRISERWSCIDLRSALKEFGAALVEGEPLPRLAETERLKPA